MPWTLMPGTATASAENLLELHETVVQRVVCRHERQARAEPVVQLSQNV